MKSASGGKKKKDNQQKKLSLFTTITFAMIGALLLAFPAKGQSPTIEPTVKKINRQDLTDSTFDAY